MPRLAFVWCWGHLARGDMLAVYFAVMVGVGCPYVVVEYGHGIRACLLGEKRISAIHAADIKNAFAVKGVETKQTPLMGNGIAWLNGRRENTITQVDFVVPAHTVNVFIQR